MASGYPPKVYILKLFCVAVANVMAPWKDVAAPSSPACHGLHLQILHSGRSHDGWTLEWLKEVERRSSDVKVVLLLDVQAGLVGDLNLKASMKTWRTIVVVSWQ